MLRTATAPAARLDVRSLGTPNAICYSGYREGQSPALERFPSVDQIREDLHLLSRHWRYLRLYDCSTHAERVLEVIHRDALDLQCLLGAYLGPELSNPGCPWGADYTAEALEASRRANERERARLVRLAQDYPDIVFAVAVGNEATVDWTDHLVPVERMIEHVRWVRERVAQPVSFCENYVPWTGKLQQLVPELDFLCVHTYPVWEYKTIEEALTYTQDNLRSVSERYPEKPIVISEAGWTTESNGRGILPERASETLQAQYYEALIQWTRAAGILTFVFEAFDEPWKGSPDPREPEKHWGLFTVDRKPKQVMQEIFD